MRQKKYLFFILSEFCPQAFVMIFIFVVKSRKKSIFQAFFLLLKKMVWSINCDTFLQIHHITICSRWFEKNWLFAKQNVKIKKIQKKVLLSWIIEFTILIFSQFDNINGDELTSQWSVKYHIQWGIENKIYSVDNLDWRNFHFLLLRVEGFS